MKSKQRIKLRRKKKETKEKKKSKRRSKNTAFIKISVSHEPFSPFTLQYNIKINQVYIFVQKYGNLIICFFFLYLHIKYIFIIGRKKKDLKMKNYKNS